MKQLISNTMFDGERPLFGLNDIRLEQLKFYPGESAVKACTNVEARQCEFWSKYPFWHNDQVLIEDCRFTLYCRAAIWYSKNIYMRNCIVEAPKMFREIDGLTIENVKFPGAAETIWNCRDVKIRNIEVQGGDYILMNVNGADIDGFKLQGNYSFQDAKNVVVRNAYLDSRDAFWKTENVTVYDSEIIGEFLGWYSKNLRFVNCKISSTQPLCYCTNVVLENCTMDDECDRCFEESTIQATINSPIRSVTNPGAGFIKAESIGELIINEFCKEPGACKIL
ncbi:MAG: DUF3737 family protein [Tannerella sp.]|jgi:hypothetical protein|nr:DUF3737 family protein [Tannerella sp.]